MYLSIYHAFLIYDDLFYLLMYTLRRPQDDLWAKIESYQKTLYLNYAIEQNIFLATHDILPRPKYLNLK